jgi:hypothetical protein
MEKFLEKIQQSTSKRWEVTETTTKVMKELMEQHLVQPTKVHTMIQVFMATLTKDMRTLSDNTTTHEATLEELIYCRIVLLDDQYEVWETYVRDKRP